MEILNINAVLIWLMNYTVLVYRPEFFCPPAHISGSVVICSVPDLTLLEGNLFSIIEDGVS